MEAFEIERANVGIRRLAAVAENQLDVGLATSVAWCHPGPMARCTPLHGLIGTAARMRRPVRPRRISDCVPPAASESASSSGRWAEFALDGRADVGHRRTRGEQLARTRRDVDTDPHSTPCSSHSITSPLAARERTKQS